jgi:hypothetical protein
VGGHERDAAGAANGSEAHHLMVEREREDARGLRVVATGTAGTVRRTPVRLPALLPYLAPSEDRLVGPAHTG